MPIMCELYVGAALPHAAPIKFTASIQSAFNTVATRNAVLNAIQNVFNNLQIGQKLYFDQVMAAIIGIPGIVDVGTRGANLVIDGSQVDISPAINELVTIGGDAGNGTPLWANYLVVP
jgi:uncharacterized phage protein gp47/JayE